MQTISPGERIADILAEARQDLLIRKEKQGNEAVSQTVKDTQCPTGPKGPRDSQRPCRGSW
jgi:hypothetical protein